MFSHAKVEGRFSLVNGFLPWRTCGGPLTLSLSPSFFLHTLLQKGVKLLAMAFHHALRVAKEEASLDSDSGSAECRPASNLTAHGALT